MRHVGRDRRDVDDRAAVALLDQPARDRARDEQLAGEVDLERAPPETGVGLEKRLARPDPRVVDEHVDPAVRLDAARDEDVDRVGVGDVAGDGDRDASVLAQARCARLDPLRVEVVEDDRGTGLGEARGGREAEPVPGARDDRDLPPSNDRSSASGRPTVSMPTSLFDRMSV